MLSRFKYYLAIFRQKLICSLWNFKLRNKNNIQPNCIIDKATTLLGNAKIGRNVIIGKNVTLYENVIIGSDSLLRNISIGENSHIERGVIITGYGSGKISIGRECYIGFYNILDFSDDIIIGNYVHIAGPSTGLWTHSSAEMCKKGDALIHKTPLNRPTKAIIIEDNVYIGGNCTIYPGVKIGHHSIIAPNSAVTKDVPPYNLVGGVPAQKIKEIKEI